MISLLREQKPDIICLQEFYINGNPEIKEQAFRDALGGNYTSHMKVISTGRNRYYGIITLSRYPVAGRGEIVHPSSSSLTIYTDIVIDSDTFRIYNNHLQSFRLRKMERSFVEEMTDPSDNEAINTVRNLSVSLRKGFVRRAQQADVLKEKIRISPYPVIVAGDSWGV